MSKPKITFPSGATVSFTEGTIKGSATEYCDIPPALDRAWELYQRIHRSNFNNPRTQTKEEDNMNNSTLDLTSLIADNTPEGMEVCKDKSTDGKIVFKKKVKSTRWEDLDKIEGYCTNYNSSIIFSHGDALSYNNNLYATNPQCKAHLAQAQLSQIMKEVNGDWEADWSYDKHATRWGDYNTTKHVIYLNTEGRYEIITTENICPTFLVFKSKELAEQVLRENTDLLEQYKPLAG